MPMGACCNLTQVEYDVLDNLLTKANFFMQTKVDDMTSQERAVLLQHQSGTIRDADAKFASQGIDLSLRWPLHVDNSGWEEFSGSWALIMGRLHNVRHAQMLSVLLVGTSLTLELVITMHFLIRLDILAQMLQLVYPLLSAMAMVIMILSCNFSFLGLIWYGTMVEEYSTLKKSFELVMAASLNRVVDIREIVYGHPNVDTGSFTFYLALMHYLLGMTMAEILVSELTYQQRKMRNARRISKTVNLLECCLHHATELLASHHNHGLPDRTSAFIVRVLAYGSVLKDQGNNLPAGKIPTLLLTMKEYQLIETTVKKSRFSFQAEEEDGAMRSILETKLREGMTENVKSENLIVKGKELELYALSDIMREQCDSEFGVPPVSKDFVKNVFRNESVSRMDGKGELVQAYRHQLSESTKRKRRRIKEALTELIAAREKIEARVKTVSVTLVEAMKGKSKDSQKISKSAAQILEHWSTPPRHTRRKSSVVRNKSFRKRK
ncbi:hypothetical protein CYMTET_47993 [Cymbomonas tetramitiformis]|uniref:Uncharacterized protein n=1 Tax=Cymbomonas tetramitiformis TaxID=36881 RepID=A0AAE0BT81_9CHLO|nr:hypothetical protein CYMTET_47993 [Cymbomonas tetramitiformis]